MAPIRHRLVNKMMGRFKKPIEKPTKDGKASSDGKQPASNAAKPQPAPVNPVTIAPPSTASTTSSQPPSILASSPGHTDDASKRSSYGSMSTSGSKMSVDMTDKAAATAVDGPIAASRPLADSTPPSSTQFSWKSSDTAKGPWLYVAQPESETGLRGFRRRLIKLRCSNVRCVRAYEWKSGEIVGHTRNSLMKKGRSEVISKEIDLSANQVNQAYSRPS
jgi:hypothetical protein